MGLHRVGQTLVLDGNLGEVLAPSATTAQNAVPAAPPPSRSSSSTSCSGVDGRGGTAHGQRSRSPGRCRESDHTVVGGGHKEGRWVMVGRGGKPQRDGQAWEHDEEAEAEGDARDRDSKGGAVVAATAAAARDGAVREGGGTAAIRARRKSRGWEDVSGGRRQVAVNSGAGGDWSVTQGSWPTLGASGAAVVDDALPGNGILSIVPSRPRGESFGTRPPEPAGFWRAFQWEMGGMRLMLGSSLQVCAARDLLSCFVFSRTDGRVSGVRSISISLPWCLLRP